MTKQMKTAEGWMKEYEFHCHDGPRAIAALSLENIQRIQADAFYAGELKGLEDAKKVVIETLGLTILQTTA